MPHITFAPRLEGVTFEVYGLGGNTPARLTAPPNSLRLGEAVMRDRVQRIADEAARQRQARRAAAAIAAVFAKEQDRAAALENAAARTVQECRVAFAEAAKRYAAAQAASDSLRSELARLEAARTANTAAAAALAAEGRACIQRLELRQEERRVTVEAATAGDAAALQRIGERDAACEEAMRDIDALADRARSLQQQAAGLQQAIASVETRHGQTARDVHDAARAAAQRAARGLRDLLDALARPGDSSAELRRVEAALRAQGGDVRSLLAQLATLRLWHLDNSATQPKRRQIIEDTRALLRHIDAELAQWRQPVLRSASR